MIYYKIIYRLKYRKGIKSALSTKSTGAMALFKPNAKSAIAKRLVDMNKLIIFQIFLQLEKLHDI
jgi:hypothetical protein